MKLRSGDSGSLKLVVAIAVFILLSSIGIGLNIEMLDFELDSSTVVSALPAGIVVRMGQLFTVDINITDVTDLYAYEIRMWYSNIVINATNATRPSGHFLEPVDPFNQYVAKWEIKNDYNSTHGRIWLGFSLLAPETARSGGGMLARITFKGLSKGLTSIILNNFPGTSGPVKLSDDQGLPISHTATNSDVTVGDAVTIDVTRVPSDLPNYVEEATVTAHVSCPPGVYVSSAVLWHSYNWSHESGQVNTTMMFIGSGNYRAKIPAYPYSALIKYKVYVLDTGGTWSISDEYNYTVVDDIAPVILPEMLPSKIVSVNVSEPMNASGVQYVLFSFRSGNSSWWNTTMTYNNGTGLWTVALGIRQTDNQTIQYTVIAQDKAGNSATVSRIYQASQWWNADLNCDGVVDIFDIVIIALHFGEP